MVRAMESIADVELLCLIFLICLLFARTTYDIPLVFSFPKMNEQVISGYNITISQSSFFAIVDAPPPPTHSHSHHPQPWNSHIYTIP